MNKEELRGALLTLARVMTAQANRHVEPMVNGLQSTMTSSLKHFVKMNPPFFFGSKVGEDPQAFLDEAYKIVNAIGVSSREKMEFTSYQLKRVSQVWYSKSRDNRPVRSRL